MHISGLQPIPLSKIYCGQVGRNQIHYKIRSYRAGFWTQNWKRVSEYEYKIIKHAEVLEVCVEGDWNVVIGKLNIDNKSYKIICKQ